MGATPSGGGNEKQKITKKKTYIMAEKSFREQINEMLDLEASNLENVQYDAENECLLFTSSVKVVNGDTLLNEHFLPIVVQGTTETNIEKYN